MIVGVLRLEVEIPESQSLKDKRAVVRSLRDRIQAKFHVSVGEVDLLDDHGRGVIGVTCVSNDTRHADEMIARIAGYAEENCGSGHVSGVHTELIHLD